MAIYKIMCMGINTANNLDFILQDHTLGGD